MTRPTTEVIYIYVHEGVYHTIMLVIHYLHQASLTTFTRNGFLYTSLLQQLNNRHGYIYCAEDIHSSTNMWRIHFYPSMSWMVNMDNAKHVNMHYPCLQSMTESITEDTFLHEKECHYVIDILLSTSSFITFYLGN